MHRFWPVVEELLRTAQAKRHGDPGVKDLCQRVDVVVPVHDALEDVERCLRALRAHTDGFDVRVLVVDDASRSETRQRLREHAERWPELSVMTLERNLGYTRAVNAGLSWTSAPWVVVLNSDTIVTAGWLTRMVRCAESDQRIGLVGPWSNAASWQSLPLVRDETGAFAVNPLPAGLDADGMAALVARVANGKYPRVPVLNGFCTLLRRDVIERVGLLDAEAFPIGYGEENDYCLRAADAGFVLAVATDAFVYHAKSRSFGPAARGELTARGGVALTVKHGRARVDQLSAVMRNHLELESARDAVAAALRQLTPGVPSILRVLFLLPVFGVSGGASSVILEAAEMRSLGAFVRVAVPPERLADLGAAYADVPGIRDLLIGPALDTLLQLGKGFDVVVATVYYTMEWVARIVAGSPNTLPAYYVQDYEPLFFAEGGAEAAAARASYTREPQTLVFAKSDWLRRTLAERHALDVVKVAPSLDTDTFRPGELELSSPLRVLAMVRPQTPRRGAARTMWLLRELSRRFGDAVAVDIFGCPPEDSRFRALDSNFPFTSHGVLRRPQVAELLRASDVFVDLSDYQAFGRASLEAMASGCVPVVPRTGGGEEFARDGENALVVDTSDVEGCLTAVAELISAPARVAAMKRAGLVTASGFSLRRAALSELQVMTDAVSRLPKELRFVSRSRVVVARCRGFGASPAEESATWGAWKLPSVQRAFDLEALDGLPPPGRAGIAVVLLDVRSCAWEIFASWLREWRKIGGLVIAHVVGATSSPASEEACRWLASACDALVVSSEPVARLLAKNGVDGRRLPLALDPIAWRLGPAGRRLAERREPGAAVRVGLLAEGPGKELGATLRAVKKELQRFLRTPGCGRALDRVGAATRGLRNRALL